MAVPRTWCVKSNGMRMVGLRRVWSVVKTREAASGSHQILNSAWGVQLPLPSRRWGGAVENGVVIIVEEGEEDDDDGLIDTSPIAPPMTLKPLICPGTSGNCWNNNAIVVRGPVAIIHTSSFGCARILSAMCWTPSGTASTVEAGIEGSRGTPSRPVLPWISGAKLMGRISGLLAPRTTGKEVVLVVELSWPRAARMARALWVV